MRDYIILNNKNSNEIKGLLIQNLPPITKPRIRAEIEEIDGRDGDIVTPLGYGAYDKVFSIGLYGDFDINEVIKYFDSEGIVVFSNEPNKYYNYKILEQIDFEKLIRFRTADVMMHVQPFKYSTTEGKETEEMQTKTASGSEIDLPDTNNEKLQMEKLKGNTSQETTEGYNILPNILTQGTSKGITYQKKSDGSMVLNGTSTGTVDLYVFGNWNSDANTIVLSPQKYVLGIKYTEDEVNKNVKLFIVKDKTTAIDNTSSRKILNIEQETTVTSLLLRVENETTLNNYVIYPILYKGEDLTTPYEPYTNGASPNPDYPQEVKVVTGENTIKVESGNLINPEELYIFNSNRYIATNNYTNEGKIPIEAGTTYSFIRKRGIINDGKLYEYDTENNRTQIAYVTTGIGDYQVLIFTTSSTAKTFGFFQGSANTYNTVNDFINEVGFMLLKGDYSSTTEEILSNYIPYQSISYPINLNPIGTENLALPFYNLEYETEGLTMTFTLENIIVNGIFAGTQEHFVGFKDIYLDAGTYKFSGCPYQEAETEDDYYFYYLRLKDMDTGDFIIDFGKGNEFTIDSRKHYNIEIVFLPGAELENAVFTPTILTANSYELYKIGDYQDYLYKNNGKWFKYKEIEKIVLDGTRNWIYQDETTTPTPRTVIRLQNVGLGSNLYFSSHFIRGGSSSNRLVLLTGGGGTIYLSLDNALTGIDTTDDSSIKVTKIKTWLSNNNVTLYYVLATPTEEEITDETLLAQLEALDNIYNQKGTTYIKTNPEANNMPLDLDVSYTESRPITITNSGNIYSKPIFTIYGEGNIGVYLNDIQLFDINLGSEEQITIDVAEMQAYNKGTKALKNRLVTGNYDNFVLKVGENKISFSGIVKKFEIENYSRWI